MVANYPVDPKFVPGGVTAVAHYLTMGLGRIPELDLHVVCCQRDVPRDFVEARDGATVHFLTNDEKLTLLLAYRRQRRKVARTIRSIAPDLVHAQGLGLATLSAIDSGLPFVVSLHGVIWKESAIRLPSPVKRWRGRIRARSAYRQILRTRNVFITSGYAADALPPEGSYRQFVVNNPVGDRLFRIRNDPKAPRVLVVGGTRQRKDPMTAVRVMERVLAEVPDATMHLLGPPSGMSLDREVEDYVATHGLKDRVRLLGLVPEEVLFAEYANATLLLLTSLEETAPVSIAEAYAVGIPVVGTAAGGIPHMVKDGETGFVRPVGDVEGLAGAVIRLLTSPVERDRLARRAAEAGREEFSLDAIARKTLHAYREIAGG
jgi:glycosyltransferase involved in cell wall biosynthesis